MHEGRAEPVSKDGPDELPVAVVGCGATKRAVATNAGDMYLGAYHRACRAVAAQITTETRTFILSARHGLLPLRTLIEPYDLRMGQPGSVTGETVRNQADKLGLLTAQPVVVLAGRRYSEIAKRAWPTAHTPLEGVSGIGQQLKMLKELAATPSKALPYQPPTPGPAMIVPGRRVETLPGVGPKRGGRYGGPLVSVGAKTSVVACGDGIDRRFANADIQVWATDMVVNAWSHLGLTDPATGRRTTEEWEWLGWTVAEHLAT